MALVKFRLLLLQLLLLALSPGLVAFSGHELLTWLQHSNLGYQVLQLASNSSSQPSELHCVDQVSRLLQAADAQALPALQGKPKLNIRLLAPNLSLGFGLLLVLDAWGKLPHGLLYGHFSDLGNYESCLSRSAAVIPTKYCLTHIEFESLWPPSLDRISINIGACLPASCSAAQLNRWLNNYLRLLFEDAVAPEAQLVGESNCALAASQPMSTLDWFAL